MQHLNVNIFTQNILDILRFIIKEFIFQVRNGDLRRLIHVFKVTPLIHSGNLIIFHDQVCLQNWHPNLLINYIKTILGRKWTWQIYLRKPELHKKHIKY